MAFAGLGALSAAALVRGAVGQHRLARHADPATASLPRDRRSAWALLARRRASRACVAVLVGVGALRVRGLAARDQHPRVRDRGAGLHLRPARSSRAGRSTVQLPRGRHRPVRPHRTRTAPTTTSRSSRSSSCSLLVGHLRRTGIGRTIIGVRENELGGRGAHRLARASEARRRSRSRGFVAGLGGALLGGLVLTFGYAERFFRVEDSLPLVSMAVIGGLGSLAGAVIGALWVVGLPAFWPNNRPRAAVHVEHRAADHPALHPRRLHADRLLRAAARCCAGSRSGSPPAPTKTIDGAAGVARARRVAAADVRSTPTAACSRPTALTVQFGGLVAVDGSTSTPTPGEVIGLIGTTAPASRRCSTRSAATCRAQGIGRAARSATSASCARTNGPRLGLGRTFQAATPVPRADRARDRAARARGRGIARRSGARCSGSRRSRPERRQARRGGRAHRLPRPRPLRRPLHRRAVDRHAPHRRARGGARGRAARRSASTSRPPASRSARPKRSGR